MISTKLALRLLALSVVLIVLLTVLAWRLSFDPLMPGNLTEEIHHTIDPWRVYFAGGRWLLWAGVFWRWQGLGNLVLRQPTKNRDNNVEYWKNMRPRVFGGLAIVEMLILLNIGRGV